MRDLRGRRQRLLHARQGAICAVADGENIVVLGRLQRRPHDKSVDPVSFKPVQITQIIRRLDAGGPDDQLGRHDLAAVENDLTGAHFHDAPSSADIDAEPAQHICGGGCETLRQSREDSRRRFDQLDLDLHVEADAVKIVGHEVAHRFVQFRRQFDAGGAGTDDRHMQLTGLERLILRVGAQAGVDHAAVEAGGLIERIKRDGVRTDARRAEIVRHAADRDDERIVAEHARRNDRLPFLVDARRDMDLSLRPIESDHRADAVAVVPVARVRDEFEGIRLAVERSRRDFVQQRLPDVDARSFEQGDRGLATPP